MRTTPCALLVATLALSGGTLPLPAQTRGMLDTAVLERQLRSATDIARVPLLLQLAELRRDDPAAVIKLTGEVLGLLQAHPSAQQEIAARVARTAALQTQSDYPAALTEAQRAEQLARDIRMDSLIAIASYHVALVEYRTASYHAALAEAEAARRLQAPRGNSSDLVRTLNLLGNIHEAESDLDQAMESYLPALHMSEALGDEIAAARSRNNIGLIYWDLGRNEEALVALRQALAVHERLGPRVNLTGALNNVGLVLIELNRPTEGLPYLERALALDRETGNLYGQAKEYSNIGFAHEKLRQFERATEYHRQAFALRERIGDKDGMVRSGGALAEMAMLKGDFRGAIKLWNQSIALARSINDRRDESDQLELLSKAKAAIGDTVGAFVAYQRFHELHAVLNDSTATRHVADLEARYRTREKERDLAALEALATSRREKLKWLISASIALATSLVLLAFLYALRARSARAIAESEQRYRALFKSAVVPTFLIDVTTRKVLDMNDPARTLCQEFTSASATIDDIEPDWVRQALAKSVESPASAEYAEDLCWTEPSGRTRWTEIRGSAVTLGGRSSQLVSVRDATEIHALEEARQREEKMRSLGVLAGGIAHDFNNALTAIVGHVSLAKDANDPDRLEMLALAEQAAMGASRLTAQLLAFSKGGKPLRRNTDLGRLVRDTVALAGAGSHMRIDLDIADDLWHAHVDSGQVSQVVSNLVINAKQATGEGGRLLVRARNCEGPLATAQSADDLRFVRIDFIDNGPGIPEDIRNRVFDPYFTTKSGGSGLGLATAFAICRNHGGALTLDPSGGRGTVFHAYFPAAAEAAAEIDLAPPRKPNGEGSILVLDDEPLVRHLLQRVLEQWGYDVEAVGDGQSAVRRYLERDQAGMPFDLLIMDLTIPGGMGGRQAIAEILAHDPSARAIVASGYSDDPTMANYREAGFVAALAKPFQPEQLAHVVSAVMRETATR
ncbi:MAG: response regulator [Gemmatimonadaceae bacterium]